ncbi:hypothetical protein O3P69_013251 [Scylla paramamosain]|uniref:Uncharacterized protein n=1 Tax=Scylla paramamosain TaxID=85552 RepID=A0AAW0TZ99_SCYPA
MRHRVKIGLLCLVFVHTASREEEQEEKGVEQARLPDVSISRRRALEKELFMKQDSRHPSAPQKQGVKRETHKGVQGRNHRPPLTTSLSDNVTEFGTRRERLRQGLRRPAARPCTKLPQYLRGSSKEAPSHVARRWELRRIISNNREEDESGKKSPKLSFTRKARAAGTTVEDLYSLKLKEINGVEKDLLRREI